MRSMLLIELYPKKIDLFLTIVMEVSMFSVFLCNPF